MVFCAGELVWAPREGSAFPWPARVQSCRPPQITVRFVGERDISCTLESSLTAWASGEKKFAVLSGKGASFAEAVREARGAASSVRRLIPLPQSPLDAGRKEVAEAPGPAAGASILAVPSSPLLPIPASPAQSPYFSPHAEPVPAVPASLSPARSPYFDPATAAASAAAGGVAAAAAGKKTRGKRAVRASIHDDAVDDGDAAIAAPASKRSRKQTTVHGAQPAKSERRLGATAGSSLAPRASSSYSVVAPLPAAASPPPPPPNVASTEKDDPLEGWRQRKRAKLATQRSNAIAGGPAQQSPSSAASVPPAPTPTTLPPASRQSDVSTASVLADVLSATAVGCGGVIAVDLQHGPTLTSTSTLPTSTTGSSGSNSAAVISHLEELGPTITIGGVPRWKRPHVAHLLRARPLLLVGGSSASADDGIVVSALLRGPPTGITSDFTRHSDAVGVSSPAYAGGARGAALADQVYGSADVSLDCAAGPLIFPAQLHRHNRRGAATATAASDDDIGAGALARGEAEPDKSAGAIVAGVDGDGPVGKVKLKRVRKKAVGSDAPR